MDLPKIDQRTREDLVQYIKKYLSSYAPEWKFDEKNPDVGTALSLIYADMMWETIYRLNQVPKKNKAMFFKMLGARLLPAIPSQGYITFSLVNDQVSGVCVKKGETLFADTEEGETIVFETLEDVYVTPAKPDCLYLCNGKKDFICRMFQEENGKIQWENPTLFQLQDNNLQEHEFYFSHPYVLEIQEEAEIACTFWNGFGRQVSEEIMTAFLEEENVIFQYYSKEGFVPLESRKLLDGQIVLKKGGRQPAFALYEYQGVESYWIRCQVFDTKPFLEFFIKNMTIRSIGKNLLPEAIYAKGIDEKIREFFPFGERVSLYDEVYFISQEVFSKKGAWLTLEFDLDFATFPREVQEAEREIDWKIIMKRSDLKVDLEYDITIAEVIWEYYNGEGFTRLTVGDRYQQIFGIENGSGYRRVKMQFPCPEDLEPVFVNSTESSCIRARVLKINNLYKIKGNYITPFISNLKFSYEYKGNQQVPAHFSMFNNLETISFGDYELGRNQEVFAPLIGRQEAVSTLYLGFQNPPLEGPLKILFSLEENMIYKMPALQFEYGTKAGWKSLSVIDETENFKKTGILTMMGNPDFEKSILFSKERYWIRILDVNDGYYFLQDKKKLQKFQGIYINTTKIQQDGGGEAGNLPCHKITRLNRNIGFISQVDNPELTSGGCNVEELPEALNRSAASLRHGYRAVTASDYELLAKEGARNIYRARCFSNRDQEGQKKYGHITLVILQKDYQNGRKYFDQISNRVLEFLKDKMSPNLLENQQFHIIEPDFIEVSVTLTLQVKEFQNAFDVRLAMEQRLEQFLNPITGNYHQKGWEIGSMPNTAQLLNAIKDIPGNYYVENIHFTLQRKNVRGVTDVDFDKIKENPYVLPVSGRHHIMIQSDSI